MYAQWVRRILFQGVATMFADGGEGGVGASKWTALEALKVTTYHPLQPAVPSGWARAVLDST